MSKVEKKKIGFMSGAPLGVGGVSAAPPAVDATNGDVLAPKGRIRPRMGGSSMVPDAMPGRAPESAVAAPTYNAFTTGMRSGRFDTPPDAKPQQRGHLEDAAIVDRTEYTPQRTRESQLVGPDGMPKQVGHLNDAAFVEEGAYDPQHSREVQTSYPDAKPQQRGHLEDAAIVDRTEYTPQRTRESQLVGPDGMPKQVGHLNDAAFVEEGAYDPQHSREVQTSYPDAKPQQAIHDKRGSAVEEMRPEAEAPVFEKDDTRRDGGFFKWLGGLSKKRPGRREGESDDDYDERMTRNKMRMAVLADAIRHMGNIYYTSKGAPAQKFNNPVAELQAGLDKRKAERARKAAAEADSAYKNANLQIKMDAAAADRAYKGQMLDMKRQAGERAAQNAKDLKEYRDGILGVQQGNLKLAGDRLGETKRHNQASERLSASRLALAQAKAARSGAKGSGGANGGYGYATPYGRLTSKKQLTPQQEAQAWNEMRNLGMITPQKQRELDLAMNGYTASDGTVVKPNSAQARKIIQGAIGYGLLDASSRGESLRKTFRDGFGYADVRTSDKAKRGVNTSGRKVGYVTKTVSKSQAKQIRERIRELRKGANPIRWQGSGSKPKAPSTKGTAKGKGTDWSKYVK